MSGFGARACSMRCICSSSEEYRGASLIINSLSIGTYSSICLGVVSQV